MIKTHWLEIKPSDNLFSDFNEHLLESKKTSLHYVDQIYFYKMVTYIFQAGRAIAIKMLATILPLDSFRNMPACVTSTGIKCALQVGCWQSNCY